MPELTVIDRNGFTEQQVALIKSTVAVGATDDELQLFMYVARKTGLDPFTRQIYALKRWSKALGREVMAIQTGIDGYRVVADRTDKLAGITDPTFDDDTKDHPNRATVTVKKAVAGTIADFTATARWTEYVQIGKDGKPMGMWVKMPYLMLGKCAEALALRKAFPADLSGVYTTEEMAQADNGQQEATVTAEVERQKAAYTPDPVVQKATIVEMQLPPELDWSYQKTTGVLICRIVSCISRKKKAAGGGEYLTIGVNGQVGGKKPDMLTYFPSSHREALLASVGKIAKLETEVKGDYANIIEVLEIDGQKVDKPVESDETKARLIASVIGWDEEELRETWSGYCKGNWAMCLEILREAQERKESPEVPA